MNNDLGRLPQKWAFALFLGLLVPVAAGAKQENVPLRVRLHSIPKALPATFRGNLDAQRALLDGLWNSLKQHVQAHNAAYNEVKRNSPQWDQGQRERQELIGDYLTLNGATGQFNTNLASAIGNWDWCKMHHPLKPTESIYHIEGKDEMEWDKYLDGMRAYCARCPCDTAELNPPRNMPQTPVPSGSTVTGRQVQADTPLAPDHIRVLGDGNTYYDCPKDHPYYSPCDGNCYTSEMFTTGRIPCDHVYYKPAE